jgi:hypothetical protein
MRSILPALIEIPAAVGEIVRLQNKDYKLVVNISGIWFKRVFVRFIG